METHGSYPTYRELGFEKERNEPILSFDQVGRCCVAMAVETVVFFAFALLCEYNFFCNRNVIKMKDSARQAASSDPDVETERKRALSSKNDDIMKVQSLSKVFKQRGTNNDLVAVNRITFSVPKGECFGLLGVNGAGKTTTFKMLTTEILPSEGDAIMSDLSVVSDVDIIKRRIGYCPQFDGLNPSLTAEEHIRYYGKLRGIMKHKLDSVIDWVLSELNLEQYRSIPAGQYSGGNKRKLSTAIAFTGAPEIILLDEPTAGVDPKARRFLWEVIARMVRCLLNEKDLAKMETLYKNISNTKNSEVKLRWIRLGLLSRYSWAQNFWDFNWIHVNFFLIVFFRSFGHFSSFYQFYVLRPVC